MEIPDYLIIGSGAAGAIVANRLSAATGEDACTVLVLEAGQECNNLYSKIPAAFSKNLQNQQLMWQFNTAPSESLNGRSVYIPQGKLVGGSTSINGLVYNRGLPSDFDEWAAQGNPGWAYRDVLPYFRRTEARSASLTTDDVDGPKPHEPGAADENSQPQPQHSQYRGSHGPLHVSDPDRLDPICDTFIQTVASHGLPANNDYNGSTQRGTGYYQRTIKAGRRVSTARAFLDPARNRANLEIRTGVQVSQILFEGNRAVAVKTLAGEVLRAKREIILSAGTVNSAKILQLSGVGPASLLQQFEIPVVHDLPGVGENFQDHYFVRVAARLKENAPSLNRLSRGLSLLREILRWQFHKPSILGYSPSIAYAFLNSADLLAPDPDLQFVFTPGSYQPGKVYVLDKFPAATCGFTQQRPLSVGHVRITSNDPQANPELQPNYLQHKTDQETVLRGIHLARKFLQAPPFSELFEQEAVPGSSVQSDEELLTFARETGNTGYHLVGTCMMGPESNPLAVVNSALKVHGIEGLRVIDASIMPNVTSSNTCAASMMIGEKGADLILEDR